MAIWYQQVFAAKKESDNVLVVDFDGTIAQDHYPEIGSPLPHAKDALSSLKEAGFEIVIYTCRMTHKDGRPLSEVTDQKEKIENWLKEHEIPYDRIEDGLNGKPHAKFYIDNKNIEYRGGSDWERICAKILSEGK